MFSYLNNNTLINALVIIWLAAILAMILESVILLILAAVLVVMVLWVLPDIKRSGKQDTITDDVLLQTFVPEHRSKIETLYGLDSATDEELASAIRERFNRYQPERVDAVLYGTFWDTLHRTVDFYPPYWLCRDIHIIKDPSQKYLILCDSSVAARAEMKRLRSNVFPFLPALEKGLRHTVVCRSIRSKKSRDGFYVLDRIPGISNVMARELDTGLGRNPYHAEPSLDDVPDSVPETSFQPVGSDAVPEHVDDFVPVVKPQFCHTRQAEVDRVE
jgi:hypothetical protein